MTKLYEEGDPNFIDHPDRKALRNFTWTNESVNDWETIWHDLWWLGYKWEWQNSDRYARRYGETFKLFAVYNDAASLNMAIPLPGINIFHQIRESLLDNPGDDHRLDHAIGKIDVWLKKHYYTPV